MVFTCGSHLRQRCLFSPLPSHLLHLEHSLTFIFLADRPLSAVVQTQRCCDVPTLHYLQRWMGALTGCSSPQHHSWSSRALGTCFRSSVELLCGLCSLGHVEHQHVLHLSLRADFFKDPVVSLSSMTLI